MTIGLEFLYRLLGILVGGIAIVNARDSSNPRRWRNTIFWGVYAVTFLVGSYLPALANGVLVLVMVGVAAAGLGQGTREGASHAERLASARRLGNRLFIPVLVVPFGMAALGLGVGEGRAAYGTPTGQLLVAAGLGLLAVCWWWSGRLMRLPAEERVFA